MLKLKQQLSSIDKMYNLLGSERNEGKVGASLAKRITKDS
jgi:hypothetical protein